MSFSNEQLKNLPSMATGTQAIENIINCILSEAITPIRAELDSALVAAASLRSDINNLVSTNFVIHSLLTVNKLKLKYLLCML